MRVPRKKKKVIKKLREALKNMSQIAIEAAVSLHTLKHVFHVKQDEPKA